jgi:SH3 domain protein
MRPIWVLVFSLCAGAAQADTAYVTDSLRLGLHHSEDTSGKPFLNLVSGTALEVLERQGSYAHVRTAAGDEGWVKATYLVPEKPAQLRVAELEAELAGLRSEVDHARNARSTAEEELDRIGKQTAATAESSSRLQDTLGRLKRENEAYEARLEAYRGSLPLPWVAAALLLTLAGGFVGGLWWLDALIRRRHGGFRIY